MSVRKIRPGPGTPDIVVRKGKPLNVSTCPACGGNLFDSQDSKGNRIQNCTRCKGQVTSKPF